MSISYPFHIPLRLALLLVLSVFYSCKKNSVTPSDLPVSPLTGSRTEFTLDSIYLYATQTYLWNDALPAYGDFNPRQYQGTTDLKAFNALVFGLSQLKINPENGLAYERSFTPGQAKYSFIQASGSRSVSLAAGSLNQLAAVSLNGKGADLGLNIAAFGTELRISYINPGSPAANAGLTRACRILAINGQPATLSIAQNAIGLNSINLQLEKTDGSLANVTLSTSNYQSSPVLKTAALSAGNEHVGYIALSDFNTLSSSKYLLDQAFEVLAAAMPSTMIVDLRYNKGGYVETAAYVANLIANSGLNGKTMYVERYNEMLQQGKATYLKNQPYFDEQGNPVELNGKRATLFNVDYSLSGNTYAYAKKGSIESIRNVYFIVSGQTASASEMLINCLKPYLNVKLIGSHTYGKPVGFFGINIDQYTMYLPNFKIENAVGTGDYFNGFIPDQLEQDDLSKDFADPKEACVAAALSLVNGRSSGGALAKLALSAATQQSIPFPSTTFMESRARFNGMIKRKLKLK
ncbi:hypothetical protein AQ505_18515 [Pedobacter sp. PACM 27299]|uniref:S41 family peptidase n=1 Tax=Pedobacter sp. PACM 27299 TaxID=1727164 RepID=UPI0007069D1A|nr:S41 family peptidase [Pedobacter sp. PACM 27299]ALL07303.1 hypothetical protein AQ505_18515 [Pedobacter sp. PACM 27299]